MSRNVHPIFPLLCSVCPEMCSGRSRNLFRHYHSLQLILLYKASDFFTSHESSELSRRAWPETPGGNELFLAVLKGWKSCINTEICPLPVYNTYFWDNYFLQTLPLKLRTLNYFLGHYNFQLYKYVTLTASSAWTTCVTIIYPRTH